MRKYMFDTNIFNDLLGGKAEITPFIGKAKFLATYVQLDEIKNTRDETKRASLCKVFEEITSNSVPTESFVLGASRLGQAKLGAADNLYERIKSELDKANKKKQNNKQDSLIAETAIKNGLTLVTHDRLLFGVVTEFGGACANVHQVIKELSIPG